MNLTALPTPPELPTHRQDQIRAELLRNLDADQHRRHRPLVMATAAASVLAVGVGVTTWQLSGDGASAPPDRLEAAGPPVPGVPDEERGAIERGCTRAANQAAERLNEDPPVPGEAVEDADYKLFNLARRADGDRYALLYDVDKHVGSACTLPRDGGYFGGSSNFPSKDIRWLAGPVQEDGVLSEYGRDRSGWAHSLGRVADEVARVTVTAGGRTVEPDIVNGTYIAFVPLADAAETPAIVRAYDADGTLLAELDQSRDGCWITPDGDVIQGDKNDPDACEQAIRWPQGN